MLDFMLEHYVLFCPYYARFHYFPLLSCLSYVTIALCIIVTIMFKFMHYTLYFDDVHHLLDVFYN